MKTTKGLAAIIMLLSLTLLGCDLEKALTVTEEPTIQSPASDKFTIVRLTPSDGRLGELLKVEAHKAKEIGRVPFVEFYADWCPPCNALRKSLSDERMIDAFAGTYIIQLNVDEWKDKLHGAGFNVLGVPAFFEIDEDGKPTGRTITGAAWGEDIPENMAPPLKRFFSGETK